MTDRDVPPARLPHDKRGWRVGAESDLQQLTQIAREMVGRWGMSEKLGPITGHYVLLTPERLAKTTSFFNRHGAKIIIVARFIEGLRQANGIIAGTTGMNWRRFLIFNALGAALWVTAWTGVGYFSGSHIDTIYDEATRYDAYLAIGLGGLALAYIARRVARTRRARAATT